MQYFKKTQKLEISHRHLRKLTDAVNSYSPSVNSYSLTINI